MSVATGVNVRLMNAKVVCRIRPLSKNDLDSGGHCCLDYTTKCIEVFTPSGQYPFYCDHTFDELSSQLEIFNHCAQPLALDALSGVNSTVIAYGQTGSGKTYTIEGYSDDPLKLGIIPRTISFLLDAAEESSLTTKYTFAVSYIQIYNEKLKDLLTPEIAPIAGQERNVKIIGEKVCVKTISSYDQFMMYWTSGLSARMSSVTKTGHISSRSHSVLTIYVSKKVKGEGPNSWVAAAPAKLFLVDLAGSETIGSKPDLPALYLVEAKIINKSLSALGLVIAALTSRVTSAVHVPFRNSKLTRILEDSLGGTSKLSLIISVSPAMSDSNETLSSLRFGLRAKIMKNRVLNNIHRVSSSNYGNCNNSSKSDWTALGRTSSGSSKDSYTDSPEQTVYRMNDKIIEISLRRERRLSAMSAGSPESFKTPEKIMEPIDSVKLFDSFSKESTDVDLTLEGELEYPSTPPFLEAISVNFLALEGGGSV